MEGCVCVCVCGGSKWRVEGGGGEEGRGLQMEIRHAY